MRHERRQGSLSRAVGAGLPTQRSSCPPAGLHCHPRREPVNAASHGGPGELGEEGGLGEAVCELPGQLDGALPGAARAAAGGVRGGWGGPPGAGRGWPGASTLRRFKSGSRLLGGALTSCTPTGSSPPPAPRTPAAASQVHAHRHGPTAPHSPPTPSTGPRQEDAMEKARLSLKKTIKRIDRAYRDSKSNHML